MKTIQWILIMALTIMVTSCHQIDRYRLDAVDRQVIPYQLGEVIRFSDEQGARIGLTVASITEDWVVEDEAYSESREQYREVNLLSEDGKFQIVFQVFAKSPSDISQGWFIMEFVHPYDYILATSYDSDGNLQRGIVLDSLSIMDKTYYNVLEFNETAGNGTIQRTTQCYYNKECGLLQLKMDGKTHLQRMP